ncbi:MAG: hypothetical protein WCY21_02305 [Candidatus Cloacimonadaceae bacterium]|jgi:hypothetical protein|nr:hypothetical protein [Candidatus Cloacimonadota bacterium]MDX9949209.1 hypothetical protein [Candidatus Syntrophosphaera sp.]NLN84955.1 hypothetical protein [Candidatus Cloacimonadota bacterium]
MKFMGSVLAMIGAGIVLIVAVAAMVSPTFKAVWNHEFSAGGEFLVVAAVLAVMIAVLAYISFSTKRKLMGAIIIAASFGGIIFGSTIIDIAMLFSVLGGFALYSINDEEPKTEDKPQEEEPRKPEQK